MLLKSEWATRFARTCGKLRSARRRSFAAGKLIYTAVPEGRCWIVTTGYVKLVDPSSDDSRFIRLILGRGALFGDCPFKGSAFLGFISQPRELALAHGRVDLIQLDCEELETATRAQPELAAFMLESQTSRGQFLERRLHWQFKNPIRARMAAALRDLICYEGDRCKHGHTIDVRLTHQDLAELVGAARPVVSAELVRMRNEGLIEYTRSFFCVDDLAGLDRAAGM